MTREPPSYYLRLQGLQLRVVRGATPIERTNCSIARSWTQEYAHLNQALKTTMPDGIPADVDGGRRFETSRWGLS